jgi:Cu/Ag efflux protein CusF
VLAWACLGIAAACGDRGAPAPKGGAASSGGARRYTVRGEVVRLPDPRAATREIALRHEAIEDFADATGAVVGMDAMVMPFVVAAGVSTEGLAPGDKVEVVLAVDWARPSLALERLRKLPSDTALRFEAARGRSR